MGEPFLFWRDGSFFIRMNGRSLMFLKPWRSGQKQVFITPRNSQLSKNYLSAMVETLCPRILPYPRKYMILPCKWESFALKKIHSNWWKKICGNQREIINSCGLQFLRSWANPFTWYVKWLLPLMSGNNRTSAIVFHAPNKIENLLGHRWALL